MRIEHHSLFVMNVFVVGRSLGQRCSFTQSTPVAVTLVTLTQLVQNINNLLHWKGEQTKSDSQTPISPAESTLGNMECNRPKLNNENLQDRGDDPDRAEQGISENTSEYVDCKANKR
jgi:hypothetical protein